MNTTGNSIFDGLLSMFDKGIDIYNMDRDRKVAIAEANITAETLAAQNKKPTQVIVQQPENMVFKFLSSTQGQIVIAVVVVVVVFLVAKFAFKK